MENIIELMARLSFSHKGRTNGGWMVLSTEKTGPPLFELMGDKNGGGTMSILDKILKDFGHFGIACQMTNTRMQHF
jgi:hypothetical protein